MGGGGVFLLCISVSVISIILILWVNIKTNRHISPYRFLSDSNAIMAITTAVTSFMFFKKLHIPYNKCINRIGASTFGVLLIHANSETMRHWLWIDIINCINHYNDTLYWFIPIISVICIFFFCIVIDYIRIKTIEKWIFNWIDQY